MSTIDLTKVAGFKAVDAEGNDMGIVSLSEMTNMVKESIIQEAVAMQSVSTLAETSTLAATDTYEDRLQTSDTFSHVRTLDANGNPRRTSSQAFATVVGGLIGIVTPEKNGLKPAFEATVVFQKANNTKACILVNTNHAGETFTALLGISGVSGYTATIIITVNKWNSTMLFAKTLVGTIPDGAKLSYKIDTSGNVNIYINSTAYLLITLKPISTINASIDTVSAIPDGTISISL